MQTSTQQRQLRAVTSGHGLKYASQTDVIFHLVMFISCSYHSATNTHYLHFGPCETELIQQYKGCVQNDTLFPSEPKCTLFPIYSVLWALVKSCAKYTRVYCANLNVTDS